MAKALANYTKLANDEEVRRDGFNARAERTLKAIEEVMPGGEEGKRVSDLIQAYARAIYFLGESQSRLDRYVSLRDKPPAKAGKGGKT